MDGAGGIVGVGVEFGWPGSIDVVEVSGSFDPIAVLVELLDISVGAVALPLEPLEFSDEAGSLEFSDGID